MSYTRYTAEAYFTQLHASLAVGVPKTSGYPALANLLNAVGESLKPKITFLVYPTRYSTASSATQHF